MPRIAWIALCLGLLAPPPVTARQAVLTGIVRDSSTTRPLAGVTVAVPAADLSTRTLADGTFRLPDLTAGDHTIFVRLRGFEPWAMRMTLSPTAHHEVSLGVISLAPAHQATFMGTVVDSATGAPIAGARVSVPDELKHVTTGDDGHFVIPGIYSGEHELVVRFLGYASRTSRVALTIPEPLEVDFGRIRIAPRPVVQLEDIRVEGERFQGSMVMRDFYTRRRTEQGTFMTSEDIERLNPKNTSDIFRTIPGMNALRNGQITSGRGIAGLQGFDACTVQYYIDGVKVTASTIDVILPNTIAGIEIYRGSATTPHIFRSQSNANCGVIVLWTKDGRGG